MVHLFSSHCLSSSGVDPNGEASNIRTRTGAIPRAQRADASTLWKEFTNPKGRKTNIENVPNQDVTTSVDGASTQDVTTECATLCCATMLLFLHYSVFLLKN
uniref:Uncharacterized protein n=1 Tax=Nelumbo nucifera TaxID=4432 RepID=A0A822YKQ4_NELNU|nr:TPA_asm: hypothetical protein HUJ06_011534 [Nelumbo nucifera]